MPDKHLMICVGDNISCKDGIRFVSNFFQNKDNLKITLFAVTPTKTQSNSRGSIDSAWKKDADSPGTDLKNNDPFNSVLESCSDYLLRNGFDKENIIRKVSTKKTSTVQDIIHSVETGLYDSLVIGKRSSSFLQDVATGSVSNEILSQSIHFPLWLCRAPDLDRKNVLLCADDSESSLRAADHVGYILQGQPDHSVTIMHIDRNDQCDHQSLFDKIVDKLLENGLGKEKITAKIIKGKQVTKTILKEINQHKYAAVAVGWTGKPSGGRFSMIFHDSSSQGLIKDLEKTALWVIK